MSVDVLGTNCDQCRSTVRYCFTHIYTETIGLLGRKAQDGHLDFHTAPELWQINVLLCGKNDRTARYKLWVSCSVCLQSVLASTRRLHKFSSLNCNNSSFKFCYLTATLNSLFSVDFVLMVLWLQLGVPPPRPPTLTLKWAVCHTCLSSVSLWVCLSLCRFK